MKNKKAKEIKLDLNKIEHRVILSYFSGIRGTKLAIQTLADQLADNEEMAWKLVRKEFPETIPNNLNFNYQNLTFEVV